MARWSGRQRSPNGSGHCPPPLPRTAKLLAYSIMPKFPRYTTPNPAKLLATPAPRAWHEFGAEWKTEAYMTPRSRGPLKARQRMLAIFTETASFLPEALAMSTVNA